MTRNCANVVVSLVAALLANLLDKPVEHPGTLQTIFRVTLTGTPLVFPFGALVEALINTHKQTLMSGQGPLRLDLEAPGT